MPAHPVPYFLAKVLQDSGARRVIESMLKRFFKGGSKLITMNAVDLELLWGRERMSLVL